MAMQVKFPFGKLVSVLVTHVDDASGNFFIQINDEAGKLDALMTEIEQTVLSGRATPPKASEIIVGCIYIVQYQEDNRWYRARVLGVNMSEQHYEVFFVDYGNTEIVPLACVRNAESRFCELSPQSFECELEGFDCFRGDHFDESLALLTDTILEQELFCKALQLKKNCVLVTQLFVDDRGTRSVFDEIQSGGLSAATDSLSNGHATSMPRQSTPKKQVKYEPISLPPDSFHDLSVTWVEDPSHFWCQLLSNLEILEKLMENLAEVYTNLDPAVLPLQSCAVGYPCCAKFYDDDAWYRAVITNVSSIATGKIEVRFVDYGNTQYTELSDVKDLKEEFLKNPCQAINFAISGVEPASKDGLWAVEAKALFEKLINFKHVVGLVTSVENDGRHRVKLMDTTSDLDMELNQILIAANYGIKTADVPKPTATTIPAAGFGSAEPAPKKAPYPVFVKENIHVGKEEKVLVTNIINPGNFYCQLFRNGPSLENLMMEVGRHYSRLGANEELLSSPSPGDPCCAQFSEDGCWYRATVLNTTAKGVTVLYIDYGNSETVPAGKIKKLIPKFSDLPQQGIECTLNRIKPKFTGNEPQWKPCDTEKFKELALEMEGNMTVVARDSKGVCRVELVVKNRQEEQNISEQLLIGGNAELADGALSSSANFNNLKSQTFSEPDLEVGQFEDVIVSFIEHPCNFWCQLQKSAPQLDLLMQKISETYSVPKQTTVISNPMCGMLCCAQFTEDDKWYRGKITGVKKGGLVEVHFVDYGNFEELQLSRVKKLQAEFLSLPPQAVKCALAKIDPQDQKLLGDDVMGRFEELTLDKELVMMADRYDKDSGLYEVVLLDTSEGKNLDIGKDLQTIIGPSLKREAAHIGGVEIQPGTTERVFVSSATSPAKFSCQLMKMADSLDELMNQMFEYYEEATGQQEQMLKPSVGEFCAAKFTLDDGWYRAKVFEVQGNDVSVLYVDYGNSETLSLSRLRVLNSKFHSFPSQAIDCSLSGSCSGVSDAEFQELVSEKEFMAKVLSVRNGIAVVDLVSKETNESISSLLNKDTNQPATTVSACKVANLQWKTGETVNVYVPFAENAQKFFCQASIQSGELDDLMNKLEEHYSTDAENLSAITVGSYCVAWYNEGGWYRAKVEDVDGKEVKINYIDYGDSATVPLSSIRTLKHEFSLLPAQAVVCCLKGSSSSVGPENFKDLVLEQEFKAQIVGLTAGGIYEVDLVTQDGSTKVSQMLSKDAESSTTSLSVGVIQWKEGDKVDVYIPFVESPQKFFCQDTHTASDLDGLMGRLEEHYNADQGVVSSVGVGAFCVARYEDGGWYRAQVTQVQGDSIAVFYIDYGDTAVLPLSSIRTLIPEFAALPPQAVKCSLRGYSTSGGPHDFKDLISEQEFQAQVIALGSQNTYEVELLSKDGIPVGGALSKGNEMVGAPSCIVSNIQWKQSDKVDVYVPFVESVQKFFCQATQTSSDLEDLMAKLEEYYSSDLETVASILAGTFCVAQYEDGGWYRAQVTQVQGDSITVFYMDYGDTAVLPISSLRTLRSEFSILPAQAVRCCLRGYSSTKGPEQFKDLVIEQEFEAHVIGVSGQNAYEVELVSKDGSSISKALFGGAEDTCTSTCSIASIQWNSGDKVAVSVSFVESAQFFYCQPSESFGDLDDLMTRLEEHYSTDQGDVTSVSAGSFCVAKYEDGGWYRAQVIDVQGQTVNTFYIDYGDTATLPLNSIRTLKPAFSTLPAQAVQCSLKGFSDNQGPENFKDLVLEQEFDLQVVSNKSSGLYEVELLSKDGSRLFGDAMPSESKTEGPTQLSDVTAGSFVPLCPTACVSPHQFHCQIAVADSKVKLEQLMDQLQECCEAIGDEQTITSPTVGMNCAAVFADDSLWYRGRITRVVDQEFVEVFYLDFGNCETLPLSKVKTMSPDLLQLRAQAVLCSLSSIAPVSSAAWPEAAVERLNSLVIHKQLIGKVIRKGSDESLEIELFDTTDSSVDVNIGELLVKEGLATWSSPSPAKPAPAIKSLSALEKIKPAENEKVYVTAVESPSCFYCQINGSEDKLTSLMAEISVVYDSLPADELVVTRISVDDVCCAQFSEDNQWYRAVVEEKNGDDLTVRFIDYGNTETLPISRTKVLDDAFFQEPPLAIKCSLHGVQSSAGHTWQDKAATFFEEFTSETELDAKFLSFTEPFQVNLSSNGVDLGRELVNTDLAAAKPTSPCKSSSDEYTHPAVECGEMYDVCVTHISSPGRFFCQLVNLRDQLEGMMNDLNNHFFQLSETEGCLVSPSVGQPCIALYDEMWYRAKVVSLSVNDLTAHYVDYGNDETLKPSAVKQMTQRFLKLPQVAIECSIDLNRDEWSEEATALFEELTGENQLIIKVLSQQGDRYQVKLFDTEAQCISEEVFNIIPGAVQELLPLRPTLKQLDLNPGQMEDVYVVHTESSGAFYIQLSKGYQELTQMMVDISEVYSGLADDVRPEDLVVGTPLCALFPEDGLWYRAVIESMPSEFEVQVRYIDYGNSAVVLLSDVRQLSRRFYDCPVQAVRCHLSSTEQMELFQQGVDGKELKATFLSLENVTWTVSLKGGVEMIPEDIVQDGTISEYLKPTVKADTRDRVYVSHVVSPDEFYVQFESSLDELSLLSGEISQFYSQIAPSDYVLNNPFAGMSCCARFSQDGDWYRGIVQGVSSYGAHIEFIDYGNSEVVPFHEIKDPHKKFMQLPRQAILCGLDVTKDRWTAQETNIFKSVTLDKTLDATFMIRDGQRWRVRLESEGLSVVNLFVASDSVAASQQQEEKKVSSVQTKSYIPQSLSSGQIEEVFVSHVTESGDFYVQLSKTQGDLGTIEILVSEFYDQLGPGQEAMEMCFVDSLCCAKFSEDIKWYRALVTKVFSDTEVEVLFVDYGNTDSLKVETVKQIKPELLTFPLQAVKCHLEGSKEIWTDSDVEQFEANVVDKPLHVTFTRQEGDTWFVTIQELDMFITKELPKVKSFTNEVFDCNKRENVFFLYADSPDCIWLQPERTGSALTELMDQIVNDVTGQSMRESQLMPSVPCLGQFTGNDVWHRAKILDIQGSNCVTVFYVDYGNSETLPLERLQPISDAHFKLPAQAICCRMADVQGVDPTKVTNYLNEVLFEKVLEVEVQEQHSNGSYTVKLYEAGAELSINDLLVSECLGDTSLLEEAILEETTPLRPLAARENRAFKLPELTVGSKVPVSFISAFLPAEMQLLLTERIKEREQLSNSITSLYEALHDGELKIENPAVGDLCCVHFSAKEDESKKWFRGEIVSISADESATVKLVDYGTHEKILFLELKSLKDELLEMPVCVMESSLANIFPSEANGQWSPQCSNILESLCSSKALIAEVVQLTGSLVELILYDDSRKSINQTLVDMGYAMASATQEDFSGEELSLKWPEFEVGQRIEVYAMAVKDLQSIRLQLANSETDLTKMREQLTSFYSSLHEAEEVVGNPRVGQVCCAQFADDGEWYRAVVTCVSDTGGEVKFVDYGNMDVALSIKQLREDFYVLPVQCFECCLNGVVPAANITETEVAAKLLELCDGKQLTAEVVRISGDSVVVNLFGESEESMADVLVKLGHVVSLPALGGPTRVSVSEDGKIVYKHPQCGDVHNVTLLSINSPSNFWCQLKDSVEELHSLTEKIEPFYENLGENDLRLFCLQVGDICCAKFTDDDKWYRSQVTEVCSNGQGCVRSVDYFKQEILTLDRIKKLEAEFAVLPVQTINCGLGDIEPPHKYYGEEWSSEAVGRFKELCEGKDLQIKVKGNDDNLTLVKLLDSTGLSIADQLLSEGLAVEAKSPLTVLPKKDQQLAASSSAEQVDGSPEECSEEDFFDAELGTERVDTLAKEDEIEEEEEFYDSNDQAGGEVTSESTFKTKQVESMQDKELQEALQQEEVDVKQLAQTMLDILERKLTPGNIEEQRGSEKEQGTAEQIESEDIYVEEIEDTEAQDNFREDASEEELRVEKEVNDVYSRAIGSQDEEGHSLEEAADSSDATREELMEEKEVKGVDGPATAAQDSQTGSSDDAREEQELTVEKEVKGVDGPATAAQDSQTGSSDDAREEQELTVEKEVKDVHGQATAAQDSQTGSSDVAREEQKELRVEKEVDDVCSPATATQEYQERSLEEIADSFGATREEQEELLVEKEVKDVDSQATVTPDEQEPSLEETADSSDAARDEQEELTVEKEVKDVDSRATVTQDEQEPSLEETADSSDAARDEQEELTVEKEVKDVDSRATVTQDEQEPSLEETADSSDAARDEQEELTVDKEVKDVDSRATVTQDEREPSLEETVDSSDAPREQQEELAVEEEVKDVDSPATTAQDGQKHSLEETDSSASTKEEQEVTGEKGVKDVDCPATATQDGQKHSLEETDSSDSTKEEQEELAVEEEVKDVDCPATATQDGQKHSLEETDSSDSTKEEQEELAVEEEVKDVDCPATATQDGQKHSLEETDSSDSTKEEQEELAVEEEVKDVDCPATATQDKPEPRLEETAACAVEAEHEEIQGVMEQSGGLRELQGDMKEAFSEEDLTAITGSIDNEVDTAVENKSDEERTSLEETPKQMPAAEESSKVFLEEIILQVCCAVQNATQSDHKRQQDLEGAACKDVANGTTPSEEKTPDPSNTDPENRDDVDKDVLSDEALEQLDRELEKVNPEEKQLEVSGTGVILNGTGDKETVAVIVKEPQEAEQSDTTASTGQDGFLTKVNGSTEVGNDLAEVGSDVTVE